MKTWRKIQRYRRMPDRIAEIESAESRARYAAEFAWRVHGAQETWANNADIKASILLALEGGALLAVVSAHVTGGFLAHVTHWRQAVEAAGLALLLIAVAAAAVAIFPRLGRVTAHRDHRHQVIFFGNIRLWRPDDLKARLATLTTEEELDALSHQLVEMATMNWRKHRWVQLSLVLALLGILLVSMAGLARL